MAEPLAKAAASVIAPRLKAEGFRKQGLTWNRSECGLTTVVNIQKSQWGSRDDVKFTVNLGVAFTAEHGERMVAAQYCMFPMRVSLGRTFPGRGEEVWWRICPYTDDNALSAVSSCAGCLFDSGLCWLDARRRPQKLVSALREDQRDLAARGARPEWIPYIDQLIERVSKMPMEC